MASSSRSGCASPALNRKSSVATSRRRTSSEPSRGAAVARTLARDRIGAGSSGAKVLKIARRRTTSRCVAANGSAIGPTPGHGTPALVVLLHRDVDHEAIGRGAVPVVLTGLEEDAVAGPDDLDASALALAQADALRHKDRLSVRMGVPSGARAGREVH